MVCGGLKACFRKSNYRSILLSERDCIHLNSRSIKEEFECVWAISCLVIHDIIDAHAGDIKITSVFVKAHICTGIFGG